MPQIIVNYRVTRMDVTLVTAKTIRLLLCACTRAREEGGYRYFYNSNSLSLYFRAEVLIFVFG